MLSNVLNYIICHIKMCVGSVYARISRRTSTKYVKLFLYQHKNKIENKTFYNILFYLPLKICKI